MEGDLLGLHLSVLHVHLVTTQDNRDVLANPAKRNLIERYGPLKGQPIIQERDTPAKVPVPCRNVLVGQSRCDVKHDDGTLAMDAATRRIVRLNISRHPHQVAGSGTSK